MAHTKLSREQLHALVWEKPLRTVAKEFGISDVGLSKICKRHGVPTPPQGHWTRVQMGRQVAKGVLPPAAEGQSDEINIMGGASPISVEQSRDDLCPPGEEERRNQLIARETQAEFSIVVREYPKALHPMAAQVQKVLKAQKPDDYGCVRCSEPSLPNVRVTPESAPRAVALVDALARAADARGFRWKSGGDQRWNSVASIVIEDINFSMEIYEVVERRPHELTSDERARKAKGTLYWIRSYDYFGTDRFSIRRSEWDQYYQRYAQSAR